MLEPNFNLENVGDNPTFTMPGIMDIHEEPDYIKKMKFVGIRAKILKNSRDNKSVSSFFKTTTKDLELEKIDD